MNSLVGSKTAENLAKAFAGESQARNRYTIYAEAAEKEEHFVISDIFKKIADNERAHAKIFFDFLIAGLGKTNIKVDADYPIGFGNTEQNLTYAAEGEKEEWGTAYPSFAEIAKNEGYPEVEIAFKKIIEIEKQHEQTYLGLSENLKNGTLYKKADSVKWKCSNCGYVHEGIDAPLACPACKYPQGYFEEKKQ